MMAKRKEESQEGTLCLKPIQGMPGGGGSAPFPTGLGRSFPEKLSLANRKPSVMLISSFSGMEKAVTIHGECKST